METEYMDRLAVYSKDALEFLYTRNTFLPIEIFQIIKGIK